MKWPMASGYFTDLSARFGVPQHVESGQSRVLCTALLRDAEVPLLVNSHSIHLSPSSSPSSYQEEQ